MATGLLLILLFRRDDTTRATVLLHMPMNVYLLHNARWMNGSLTS
jgi:hypothetical protein